jgi:hypothetical protein
MYDVVQNHDVVENVYDRVSSSRSISTQPAVWCSRLLDDIRNLLLVIWSKRLLVDVPKSDFREFALLETPIVRYHCTLPRLKVFQKLTPQL